MIPFVTGLGVLFVSISKSVEKTEHKGGKDGDSKRDTDVELSANQEQAVSTAGLGGTNHQSDVRTGQSNSNG